MSNIDKQDKSVIRELIADARSRRLGKLIITADEMEALLDELEAKDKQIADQCGIIASARKFISEYAGLGDVGAAEFIKIIDRAAADKGE
ncbi:hypothetical protein RJO44_002339 [Enterobacter hormaechei]|nr:hypothetical protein [Enterobacter hormaechei]